MNKLVQLLFGLAYFNGIEEEKKTLSNVVTTKDKSHTKEQQFPLCDCNPPHFQLE